MSGEPIPLLDQQYEDILSFTIDLAYKFDKECDSFISAPRCEKVKTSEHPITAYNYEGVAIGHSYEHWRGHVQPNARKCPYCQSLHFNNCALNTINKCRWCGKDFAW